MSWPVRRPHPRGGLIVTSRATWEAAMQEAARRREVCLAKFGPAPHGWVFTSGATRRATRPATLTAGWSRSTKGRCAVYGHADLLATLGRCKGDPACTAPPITEDDADPTIRRCARHALEHLRRLTAVAE